MVVRKFEDRPAVRERTSLLIGLVGPSFSGKTRSALRLAKGIVRVTGGSIHLLDTEADRALHYADDYQFRHVSFPPPFSPLDYLAAIEQSYSKRPGVIIIDSMSHEHEGPGGVLEMHEAEIERLSRGDEQRAKSVGMLAWSRPKQERRRLINTILQMRTNFIFCFRAKEKVKLVPGAKEPEQLGFMPIAGEEFIFEMTLSLLLYPGSCGVPTLTSRMTGEKMMIKIPDQFRQLFTRPESINEDMGSALAKWAEGTKSSIFESMSARIAAANSLDELAQVVDALKEKKMPAAEMKVLRESYAERKRALESYADEPGGTESETMPLGDVTPEDEAAAS